MTGKQHKVVGIGFGIAGALIMGKQLNDPYAILIAPMSAIGSMLPDIDHDRTKLGRTRKAVTTITSKTVNILLVLGVILSAIVAILTMVGLRDYGISQTKILIVCGGLTLVIILKKFVVNSSTYKWSTKHRGLMHTLVMPVILYLASTASSFPLYRYSILGLFVGYCSHLFADMLTVEGCPILWPLTRKNIRLMKLKTKDKSCTTASRVVFVLTVALGLIISGGL